MGIKHLLVLKQVSYFPQDNIHLSEHSALQLALWRLHPNNCLFNVQIITSEAQAAG